MKQILKNRKLIAVALFCVTALLFIFGRHEEAGGLLTANAIALTTEEKGALSDEEQKVLLACKKLVEQAKQSMIERKMTPQELTAIAGAVQGEIKSDDGKSLADQFKELKEIAQKQGTSLQELGLKLTGVETGNKSIAQVLDENKEALRQVYNQGSGTKEFMIQMNHKGEFVASPFDRTKASAASTHGTIAAIGGVDNVAAVTQSMSAASILRMAADAPIQSQYRNTPWIFDLCNLVNVGFDVPFAIWYEEQVKQGASATVAEAASKPLVQYAYDAKSATYKKEACLLGFTQEFQMDFQRLQSDIIGKGRTDLINRINTSILANVISAATAYNTAASFTGGAALSAANDYTALAAMAAQVDDNTFGTSANAAIMSTFKKYRLGTLVDSQGAWLDRPSVLDNLSFIGNPAMAADNVLVGDFKQYNILLRGGLIVKVGYNGTDFAENKFSVVMEQFYFDYISALRAKAIVKGTTFAAVKTALTT